MHQITTRVTRVLVSFAFLLGAGCSSADFAVQPTEFMAELTVDSQAPESVAAVEFEFTLQSGRLVDRCIDIEIALWRESNPSEEFILELEPEADFDPCFDGLETRTLIMRNAELTNAELLLLCEGDEPWDVTLYTKVDDDEKVGSTPTFIQPLSLTCV